MKVSLGCDHGGYALKEEIKKLLIYIHIFIQL